MGPQRGPLRWSPPGDKKFQGSKKADYQFKIEIQKTFPRRDIKQKEIKLGPHRGPLRWSPPGDKTFFRRRKKISEYKTKRYSKGTPRGSPKG